MSTTRGFARLLGGPPRVAPFFADLDPSTGGRVFVDAAADAFTVTWCGVRGFDSTQTTTVQATLFATGAIDVKFGPEVTLGEALVAVSPGRGGAFTPVDLSASDAARRRRGRGRRALLRRRRARHGADGAAVLRQPRRSLRSAGLLDRHGGRDRRLRLRVDGLERDPRPRHGHVQPVGRLRQRRHARERAGHGSRRQVGRRSERQDPGREQRPGRHRARDGAPLADAVPVQRRPRRRRPTPCSDGSAPTGASSWTRTRP